MRFCNQRDGGGLWDSGPLLLPPDARKETRFPVGICGSCFCLSRAAQTGTPVNPFRPDFPHPLPISQPPQRLLYKLRALRLRRALAAAILTPGGFHSEFDRGLGGGARSSSGAQAGLAEGNLLLPGNVGRAGARRHQLREQPAVDLARAWRLFQECHPHNKQTLFPSHPTPQTWQDPGTINIIVIVIS